jgi:ABC-2 type transport system permease protein
MDAHHPTGSKLVRTLIRHARTHHYALSNFIARDLRIKYRGTLLGYLWSLLEPLSLVLVYWFVFSVIAQRGGPDYPLVVILGVLPYTFFSSVITGGAAALTANRALIRRIYLPREIFVLGQAGTQLVVFLASLLAVIPFQVAYGQLPGWSALWLPAVVLGIACLATGLALVFACANVMYRDVAYLLKVLLRLGFYATPVIYPLRLVPPDLLDIYLMNPMAAYISLLRSCLTNAPIQVPSLYILEAAALSLLAFLLGAWVFARLETTVVKYL